MKTINSFSSKLFALALVLVTSVSSFAHDFSVDGIYYNVLDDNNVEVTYKGSSIYEVEYRDDVVIPDSVLYNGVNYVVASIGKSAFRACSNLTTIHIPDNLTTIGEYAFYECYKLTSVILGNNVTNIEGMAFMYCKALKSITLPNITHIGSSAFNNCLSLDSVTLGNGLRNIADNLFYLCSSLTHITIPDSIECIGEHAFYNCKLLKTIYIPNTVNMIGKFAFSGCSSLDSIHIPNGVTEIGERTFENCTSLQAVNLPKTISSIRYYAFAGCASLTEINIPEGVQKIESNTFQNCTSLLKITIPNSVMTIELGAFSNTGYYNDANNWEEDVLYISNCLIEAKNSIAGDFNIKQGTRIIADYALFGCHNLTSITFPESLKSIGDAAFYECTNLSTVNMSDSLQNIGSMAFAYCELLNPVTIPVGVKTFGTEVFYGCKSLVSVIWNAKECQDFGDPFVAPFYRISSKITSITFGDEVEYIPAGMCYGLSALSSVTIPINVKCIGKDAFESCSSIASITWNAKHYCDTLDYSPFEDISYNIKSFTFGEEIETIPPYVCKEMREITSITIPEGVKSIGRHAFNYCLGIPSVTIPKGVTTIGSAAFFHTYIESIIVPEGVTEIGGWAFSECYSLNKIELPSTLKSIGNSAFKETYYIDTLICKALVPPTMGELPVFEGLKKERTSLFVPVMSIELYRKTNIWKDFGQILPITWSEECEEYKHVNMSVVVFGNSIIFDLSNNHTIEPPYVDSVWIVNTEQEPVRKLYAQSGDTIDVSFLEERGRYILNVYIDGCRKSSTFVYRPIQNKWKDIWCDTWNVMWFDGWRFDETASTSQYRLGKDTVIGDYTYSKFTSRTSVRFTDDRKVYVYYEGFDDNDPYSEDLPTGEYLAYDFSAQVGDTLEVFSGSHSYTTEQCVVYDVQTDPETNLRTIMLHPLRVVDGDGNVGVSGEEITWLEGVGSPNGFLIGTTLPGGGLYTLLCAYQDDELKYTGSFYERFGCDYNAGVISDDLFPMLSGLQRTICREYCEQADNKTRIEQFTNLTTRTETGGPYLYCSPFLLREKDNKILIYSRTLNKDLVLYDFNLQVGDSLPMLYIDFFAEDDWIADRDMEIWCVVDYYKDLEGNILPADTLIVTDVSAITLLDGKEYKKWTFNNGMEYVEGIGSFGNRQWSGDFFQLIGNMDIPVSLHGEHLVCVSKNNKLLYQMDDAEMERLGTECLCEYNAEQKPEDLFPTLWGLQRTSFTEYFDSGHQPESEPVLLQAGNIKEIGGKLYLDFGQYLREENGKIYIYSELLQKDFVLYDFTLELGDTLTTLNWDYNNPNSDGTISVVDYAVDCPIDTLIVTDISTITLLDGKEYKKWIFNHGYFGYVESIGTLSGLFYELSQSCMVVPGCYMGDHLVCASRNGKLLYQMDDAEMERLGAECLCDYDRGPRKDNAKDGQIGGRPTPTQWNQLELDLREMENGTTILRAETFSYTLENDSIVANDKIFYQLARQSTKDTATTKSFVGALHFGKDEDNRVYFLRDGVEYVLYDFTAEPGDTVEIFAGINNYPQDSTYTHVVVDKDTTEDGACRMFLEVVFPEDTTTATNAEKVWLAGLGSIDGIVHNTATRTSNAYATPARSANSETQTSVMLCAWREDSCLYTTDHPDYDTLGCVYNIDETTAIEDIHTFPSYQKLLRDGQLFIIHEGKTYNVMGIAVE